MNKTGLSDITSLPASESETEEDNVESDWIDDSDIDKNHEQPTSSDEDSEEFDEMEFQMRANKRQKGTSTPHKANGSQLVGLPRHPSTSSDSPPQDPSLPTPLPSSVQHAAPPISSKHKSYNFSII